VPITVWEAQEREVDPEFVGTAGSPTVVASVWEAVTCERRRKILRGPAHQTAAALLERLRDLLQELVSTG